MKAGHQFLAKRNFGQTLLCLRKTNLEFCCRIAGICEKPFVIFPKFHEYIYVFITSFYTKVCIHIGSKCNWRILKSRKWLRSKILCADKKSPNYHLHQCFSQCTVFLQGDRSVFSKYFRYFDNSSSFSNKVFRNLFWETPYPPPYFSG